MEKIDRKYIKTEAKKTLKTHYFRNLIVTFIISILLAGGISYNSKNILNEELTKNQVEKVFVNNEKNKNDEIVREILKEDAIKVDEKIKNKYTRGIISNVFNEVTKSGSFIFGIGNAINKMVFHGKINIGIIMLLSNIIIFILTLIFIKTLVVGKNRYFLEKRRYNETKIQKILYTYKIRKNLHIATILLVKSIKQFLWNLTIIGGFIKYYEYKLIPYILAENPSLKVKEVFLLSKDLSKGYKWQMFKIDLSLIGWIILSMLTLNLSKIFFLDIYYESIYAEIYIFVRNQKNNSNLLHDELLDIKERVDSEYPKINEKRKKIININYDRNYSLTTYILLFFTFSIFGWLWEVLLYLLKHGKFINCGTMHGPWLPIYGWGGILIILLLKKFRNNPNKLFWASFLLCGVVEYLTSLYLEKIYHVTYWDYTGMFLNINGRVCLEGLIFFAIGGCGFTYLLAPLLDEVYKMIKPYIKEVICIGLVIIYSLDFVISSITPNGGDGISKKIVYDSQSIINI